VGRHRQECPFRFQGRRFDDETGLYYFRARYMDPEEGRFVSRDPAGIWFDPESRGNGYAFEGGNPVSRRDPSGLDPVSPCAPTNPRQ
jgi:RHS repeat-associated protein